MNKVSTQVAACVDLASLPAFTPEQIRRIRVRLAHRITKAGVLRVRSRRFRSQGANRRAALERLRELLAEALRPPRPRRKTRVPRRAVRARLALKRKRGQLKQTRRRRATEE